MKKRVLSLAVALLLCSSMFPMNSFATEHSSSSLSKTDEAVSENVEQEVNTIVGEMRDLQREGVITKEEIETMVEGGDYSEEALLEYESICQEEVEEALNSNEIALDGEGNFCQVINLDSGGQIILQGEMEGTESSDRLSTKQASNSSSKRTIWQPFGTHKYRTTVTIITLGYCTGVLKSTYNLSKNGIKLTGKSSDLLVGIGSIEALKYKSFYEKRNAGKGRSCKLLGKYKYKVLAPVVGISVGTYFEKMRQTIKCVDISKKNKKVKVRLSVKAWQAKEW